MYTPDFNCYKDALEHKKPSRIPLSEFWIDQGHIGKVIGREVITPDDSTESIEEYIKCLIEFSLKTGYDFIFLQMMIEIGKPALSVCSNHNNTLIGFEHDGVLANREKVNNFIWSEPGKFDTRNLEITNRLVPEGMKIITSHPGVVQEIMTSMGMEDFFYALHDDPEIVQDIIARYSLIIEKGVEKLKDYENVAVILSGGDMAYTEGLLIPPDVLRTMFFPHYRKVISTVHGMDKLVMFHTDGRLWEVLDDFMDMGLDGLHPIEPKAMDINEVRRKVKNNLCLVGNVDLDWPLIRGTCEDVRRETLRLLEKMSDGGSFCLGSSSSIVSAVPLENYITMLNTVHEFNGREKIRL